MKTGCGFAFALSVVLSSCGSVEIPETSFYRIDLAPASGGAAVRAGALGIGEVRIAAELASDRMIVREGPVRVSAYRFHQWAGPLDQLVADAIETGLTRQGCFADVRSDSVGADFVLDARVLTFGLSVADDGWFGESAIDFRLSSAAGDLLLRRELSGRELAAANTPEAVAVALSRAMDSILTELIGCLAEQGIFDLQPDAAPAR